jgi:hypothetical protein
MYCILEGCNNLKKRNYDLCFTHHLYFIKGRNTCILCDDYVRYDSKYCKIHSPEVLYCEKNNFSYPSKRCQFVVYKNKMCKRHYYPQRICKQKECFKYSRNNGYCLSHSAKKICIESICYNIIYSKNNYCRKHYK